MASADLRQLWQLHRIDQEILEIKGRAAAFDSGQSVAARIKELETSPESPLQKYRAIIGDIKDLELAQATRKEKIAKLDRELYSGRVINPKDVEAYEKEIRSLSAVVQQVDDVQLEKMEDASVIEVVAKASETEVEKLKLLLGQKKRNAITERNLLETRYRQLMQERPNKLKNVPPMLATRYEQIRARNNNMGMTEVVKSSCGTCGMALAERIIQGLREDRMMTCENCGRIFYFTEGVI